MVTDDDMASILFFGGVSPLQANLNDTWLWATDPAPTTSPPPATNSWYVTNFGALQSLGTSDGGAIGTNCVDGLTVLDFGQPGNESTSGYSGYGAYDFAAGGQFMSDSAIQAGVDNYATGWYNATTSCSTLLLLVGTSNDKECPLGNSKGTCTTSGAGAQWSVLTHNVATDVKNKGFTRIRVAAADDMETGWDCAALTRGFVDAYSSQQANNQFPELVNYGNDAPSNCFQYNPPSTPAWTAADVCHVSSGASSSFALPEIYGQAQADQWTTLRANSCFIFWRGVMTTTTGFQPNAGWAALYNDLNAHQVGTVDLTYSTNIKYQ
jgi:hypothetical protein